MKNFLNKYLIRNELAHIILVVILAGGITYAVYVSQEQKVNDLIGKNSKVSSENKEYKSKINTLQGEAADLKKHNILLQNQVSAFKKNSSIEIPQPQYTLQFNSIKHYWSPALLADDTYTFLVLDISVMNKGKATGYIAPADFSVKDGSNVRQQTISEWAGLSQDIYLPPPQPTVLGGQALDAGDTVRGSLVYRVLSTQTSFNVKYNGENYPVTVNGKITL